MTLPVLALALIFCSGIIAENAIRLPFTQLYFGAGFCVLLSALFLKRRWWPVALIALAFILGMLVLKNSFILPECHIKQFCYYKLERDSLVKGRICNEPEIKDNLTSFIFSADWLQQDKFRYSCCGNVLARVNGALGLSYGDEVILRGKLLRPPNFNNSGQRSNYRDYLFRQNIFCIFNVNNDINVVRLNKFSGSCLIRFSFYLKHKIERAIQENVSGITGAVLNAMILGQKKDIPPTITAQMMQTGTVHILVVSGFNVGIVAFIVLLSLKILKIPRKQRTFLAIICLILYCLLTGASNPVVRATVMGIFFLLGSYLKREPDIYNSLALAALSILVISPKQLFDIGFQLSFVSVIAIVCVYPRLNKLLRVEKIKLTPLKFMLEGLLVSFSAWLGTAGFIAYYFRIFSPITVVANIFIVPMATLITLAGLSKVLISAAFPALTAYFGASSEFLVGLMLKINSFFAQLPGACFYL